MKILKLDKNKKIILVVCLAFIALAIYFFPTSGNNETKVSISNNTEISKEEQLEKVLSNIKGTGKVSVMITYQSSAEMVCANKVETEKNTITEKTEKGGTKESETIKENKSPVIIGNGDNENALVMIEKEPEIKGVIVVAQGAENVKIKMELQKAVETVLQISPSQVEIFAMN